MRVSKMKIVLIGFACCYKTSVGTLLAEKLHYRHLDTDSLVELAAGASIPDIFARYGEEAFRQAENRVLFDIANCDDAVISCGGGSPLLYGFDTLVQGAQVVWLTASAQTVRLRLGKSSRPLFDGKTVEELAGLITRRNPYYAKYASVTVSTDGLTSNEVADIVYGLLR